MGFIQKYFVKHWSAVLLLFLGLYSSVFQITGFLFQHIAGDLGDARFIMAIVEYNYQWLIGTYASYWDGFFMYPDQEVISYSDNLLGSLPIYALFRLFGMDYLYAFQFLIVFAHAMNFILAYICFYKFTSHPIASACGAFVFAFSLSLASLYNHPQFCFRFAIPLFFLAFQSYLHSGRLKHLMFAGLALLLQFYLGIYLGYFLMVCATFYLFSYGLINFKTLPPLKQVLFDFLKVLPAILLLLFPLFYSYLKRSWHSEYYNDYNYYMQTIPRLGSYFKAFEGAFLWSSLNKTEVYSEYSWLHQLFPGILVLLSIAGGIILSFKKNKPILTLMLCLTLILSFTTYYEGHTLYGYLMKIPGIKAARVVSRIVALLVLFAGWLLCLELDLLSKNKSKGVRFVMMLFPFLLFLDNYSVASHYKTFGLQECRSRIDSLENKMLKAEWSGSHQAFAYLFTDSLNPHHKHLDAMLCALKTGKKTVNGYSSSCHRYYGPFWEKHNMLSLTMWCKQMHLNKDSLLILN